MTELSEALARLDQYNLGVFNLTTNPYGLSGVGGMAANWRRHSKDMSTVGTAVTQSAAEVAGMAETIAGALANTVPVSVIGADLVAVASQADGRALLGIGAATEAAAGLVELATEAEATAGTDAQRAVTPAGVSAAVSAAVAGSAIKQGLHTIGIKGSALEPRTANGCTLAIYELTTSGYDDKSSEAEFDYAVTQVGYVSFPLPKSYGGGTISIDARARLLTASEGQTATLMVSARIIAPGTDPSTVAWSTAQSVTVTANATAGAVLDAPTSSAITPTGTFSDGAEMRLRVERDVTTGTATTSKLRLRDLRLFHTINAATDA